jgi:hypothetical protein
MIESAKKPVDNLIEADEFIDGMGLSIVDVSFSQRHNHGVSFGFLGSVR